MEYGTLKNANIGKNTTNIQNVEIEQSISVFPNPCLDQLTISATNEDCVISSIVIYNLIGIKVMEINNLNNRIIVTELNLKTGTYLIKISSNKGSHVEKLIVN